MVNFPQNVFDDLQREGTRPNVELLVSALKACSVTRNVANGMRIHQFVLQSGDVSNAFVANTLVDMYAKCGLMVESRSVFDSMQRRDVVSWNCIISGYAANGKGDTALELFYRMTHEGKPLPDKITIISAIKACSLLAEKETGEIKTESLNIGKLLHAEAARCGCDFNIRVACTLVKMYAKCGSMQDAWNVFQNIPHPDVATWTAIISGYAINGDGRTAIGLYEKMREDKRIEPDALTYIAVFQACSALAEKEGEEGNVKEVLWCFQRGREVHIQAAKLGYERNAFVVNTLVDMYSKCKRMQDARQLFERAKKYQDAVTWNCIILGYAENGEGIMALELFERMREQGFGPSEVTYLGVVKACVVLAEKEPGQLVDGKMIKVGVLEKGRFYHLQAWRSGKMKNCVASTLVDMYAKCGSMSDARDVFEKMKERDIVSWNCLISGYALCGESVEALELYEKMQEIGFKPDSITYVAALKACAGLADQEQAKSIDGKLLKLRSLQTGKQLHSRIVEAGHERNRFIASSLVDMYGRCGSISEACNVFERVANLDDISSWNCIILRCALAGEGELAMEYYTRMKEQGCVADGLTYVAALKAFSCVAALESGIKLHEEIKHANLELDTLLTTTLIDFYGKCGLMAEAKSAFDCVAHKDIVAWNALMSGYCRQGDVSTAFDLLQQMLDETKLQPDQVMFLSLLAACSHSGLVQFGKGCFETMVSKFNLKPTVDHYCCMVDLLGRAKLLEEALAMVTRLDEANTAIWTALLSSCCRWRNLDIGKVAFKELVRIDKGYPAAYVMMSNLYAQAGMLEESSTIQAMKVSSHFSNTGEKSWWTDNTNKVHTF